MRAAPVLPSDISAVITVTRNVSAILFYEQREREQGAGKAPLQRCSFFVLRGELLSALSALTQQNGKQLYLHLRLLAGALIWVDFYWLSSLEKFVNCTCNGWVIRWDSHTVSYWLSGSLSELLNTVEMIVNWQGTRFTVSNKTGASGILQLHPTVTKDNLSSILVQYWANKKWFCHTL